MNIVRIKRLIGRIGLLFVLLICGLPAPQACAEDVSVIATVDRASASLEDSIMLTISVEGAREEPALNGLGDFRVTPRGSSSQVRIINGSMSSSYAFNYLLQPLKSGTFTIGPFTVVHKKKEYAGNTITLTIAQQAAREPAADRAVFVTAEIDNESPFVNEQIIYTFKFHRRVEVGNARLTSAPDFEGFLSESMGKEKEYRTVVNGQAYAVTELRWALFPVKSGVLTIGASTLDCEIVIQEQRGRRGGFNDPFFGDSFFGFGSRTEPKSLRTEPLTVMVYQLPAAGRPAGFSQLVGEFELSGSLGAQSVPAGDSATLTLTLRGQGNLQSLKTIDLPPLPNVKVYDDKPVFEAGRAGGSLTVKKALVPIESGELTIPAVTVAYFSPAEKQYKTARTGPFKLTVLPARQSEALQAVVPGTAAAPKEEVAVLGQDIMPAYTGFDVLEDAGEPRLTALHCALLAAPAVLYALICIISIARARRNSDSSRVRARAAWPRFAKRMPALRSALKGGGFDFFGEAARALLDFIGDKLGVTGSAMTPAEIRAHLTGAGVGAQLAKRIEALLEQCDAGRFGIAVNDVSLRQELLKELNQCARELHRSL